MSLLRATTGTASRSPNLESRPLPRDNNHKKLSLFKRWTSRGIAFTGITHHNNHNRHQHQQQQQQQHLQTQHSSSSTTTSTTASTATMVTSSSSSSLSSSIIGSSSSNYHKLHTDSHYYKHHINSKQRHHMAKYCLGQHYVSLPSTTTSSTTTPPINIMHFMQNDCPNDVLPLILAFLGPQKTCVIGRTNRFWRQVIVQESTWRRLCEELYKWKEGDEVPESWKKYYQYNPCVPVDYSTVHGALGVIEMAREDSTKPSEVRILIRPGRYVLREAITIDEDRDSVAVTIETMEYYPGTFRESGDIEDRCSPVKPPEQPKRKRKSSIRNIFQCRTVDVEEGDDDGDDDNERHHMMDENHVFQHEEDVAVPTNLLVENPTYMRGNNNGSNGSYRNMHGIVTKQATLVLRSRRHNEPLIRIRQGSCTIRNIELKHVSHGTDIWNGNAGIQIQPPIGPDDEPLDVLNVPLAILDRVDVTSSSGRGIVNIDGGHVKIINSHIHDCAATGIYIGGPGSRATIVQSDVLYNGTGNILYMRGIGRGHSGIYLEQGHADIIDCNISRNSLTGISAISPENAFLRLEDSELFSNGTFQLEMPAIGTAAHRNSVTLNNNFASTGLARSRSGLVVEP